MRNLVRFSGITLLLGSLIGTLTPAVRAQTSETIPIRIKLGALQPNSKSTRDFSGSRLLGGILDLTSSRSAEAETLSVGYFESRSNGRSLRTIPVLVSKSSEAAAPVSALTGFYTGTGLGAYFVDAGGSGFKARYGGYLSAGLRLVGGLFVEAQYHYVNGKVNGASPSGVALLIGRRN